MELWTEKVFLQSCNATVCPRKQHGGRLRLMQERSKNQVSYPLFIKFDVVKALQSWVEFSKKSLHDWFDLLSPRISLFTIFCGAIATAENMRPKNEFSRFDISEDEKTKLEDWKRFFTLWNDIKIIDNEQTWIEIKKFWRHVKLCFQSTTMFWFHIKVDEPKTSSKYQYQPPRSSSSVILSYQSSNWQLSKCSSTNVSQFINYWEHSLSLTTPLPFLLTDKSSTEDFKDVLKKSIFSRKTWNFIFRETWNLSLKSAVTTLTLPQH